MSLLLILLEITAYAAALFAAILLFRALLKKHASPVLIYAIWFLLIARLLVPVTIDAGFHLITRPAGTPVTDVSALLDGLDNKVTLNQNTSPVLTQSDPSNPSSNEHAETQNADSATASAAANQPASAARMPLSWHAVLIAVWLAGTGGLLFLAAVSSIRLKRRIQNGGASVPEKWRQMALEIADELHIRRRLRLSVVSGFPTPALSAGLRPVVVLPKELEDEEAVRFALRHELTHLRRGDHIICLVWLVLRAVYWFNPVVWASFKLMRLDMETACDSMVTKTMSPGGKTRYAQAVLAMHAKPQVRLALGMALGSTGKTVERRIRGIFMPSRTGHAARLTALLLAVVMAAACFTTACQPTPEVPVVVGKDQNAMLEKAVETPDETPTETEVILPIKEQVNAPQTYSADVTAADGKLKIVATEASIALPDTDSIPIYRVKAADFTQEQVTKLLDVLFEGQTVYEVEYGPQTKDELLERLINVKHMSKKTIKEMGWDDDDYKEAIAKVEKEYEAAPEENQDIVTVSDGLLKQEELFNREGGHLAYYDGLSVTTDYKDFEKAATFGVQNNNDMTEPDMKIETDEEGNIVSMGGWGVNRRATMMYANPGDTYDSNFGQSPEILVDENTVLEDTEITEKLKTSPAEAKKLAEEFLKKAGLDMSVCAMYLLDDENLGGYDGLISPAAHYAYKLYLCRNVNGLPVAYLSGASSLRDPKGASDTQNGQLKGISADLSFFGSWQYETIDMMINDDGIISFQWNSPLDITETLADHTNLLPFKDIADKFEQQMRIEYEAEAKDAYMKEMTWTVEYVKLELQRIAQQDSLDEGLLVPVWNFYGKCAAIMDSGEDYGSGMLSGDGIYSAPMMTINAIDGSVIDTQKGY